MKELRTMTKEQLAKQISTLREQARDLRFRTHSKEVKNNHRIKVVKKEIAQILTILNSK